MDWLSSGDLADMRGDVANLLPDSGTIQAPTYTQDGKGHGSMAYAAVSAGTVQCRFDPFQQGTKVEELAGREGMVIDYVLTVPYDAPIYPDYRFLSGGNTWEVVALAREHSWNVSRRAYVARIG